MENGKMDSFRKNLAEHKKTQRFLKYAKDNGIPHDSNTSTKELYALCNRHRDDYLCYKKNGGRGTLMNTKCYKQDYNSTFCRGWYTNEKRCGCGVKWYIEYWCCDDVWQIADLIDNDIPLGFPNKL